MDLSYALSVVRWRTTAGGYCPAVAHRPQVIFADEPTGALDTASGLAVMKLFRELVEQEHITVVMTTHDPI